MSENRALNSSALDLFTQAQLLQQSGRVPEARAIYEQIIAADPQDARAIHYLGMSDYQGGELELGLQRVNRSIVLSPQNSTFYSNRGSLALARTQTQSAESDYRRVVVLSPALVDARLVLGEILWRNKKYSSALLILTEAVALDPGSGRVWLGISHLYVDTKFYKGARAALSRIGLLHHEENLEILFQRGSVEYLDGDSFGASRSFLRLLSLRPGHVECYFRLGSTLLGMGNLASALQNLRCAVYLNPLHATAAFNMGICFDEYGRIETAITWYMRSRGVDPSYADCDIAIASAFFRLGRFRDGWSFYEARWRSETLAFKSVLTPRLETSRYEFDGDGLSKRVLIWAEQGVGDEVMFGSLLTEFRGLCGEMLLQVDRRLKGLFERSLPGVKVFARDEKVPEELYDEQIPMGSLGQWLRPTPESFEGKGGRYLSAQEGLAARLRAELGVKSEERLIGLSWRSQAPTTGLKRSLSLSELGRGLRGWRGARFVNLQYGDVKEEIAAFRRESGIEVLSYERVNNLEDLEGLSGLIEACDLVVSVGNATAHLSGALGQKTWVLLPYVAGWRWLHEGDRCPWYESVRLFRQSEPGRWDALLGQIEASNS